MKVTIREAVPGDRLEAALPSSLRGRLPPGAAAPEASYTLLLFPHDEDDTTPSAQVLKALDRVAPGAVLVAAGWNFTAEARAALSRRGAIVLARNDYAWTDERLAAVRSR